MALTINKATASAKVREAAADQTAIDEGWIERIEHLSRLCEEGISKTHIAFLGTAILAKSIDPAVDLYAIKPRHSQDNLQAYSARPLCHGVLVPLAAELGINIGVTGREPLNNQPYFRMVRLNDGTPVHQGARAAFNYMLLLIEELSVADEQSAYQALKAYIHVRRQYQPKYKEADGEIVARPDTLSRAVTEFVARDSENGRRAQAVVAGLLDAFAGEARVESGRINDPSRKYPGDVCIGYSGGRIGWEKAFEVRDKQVSRTDVLIFAKKCVDMGVREAAVVMVAPAQPQIDKEALSQWANEFGIGITLFHGWVEFIEQVLFWSEEAKPAAAVRAAVAIRQRLIAVEASPNAIVLWDELLQAE